MTGVAVSAMLQHPLWADVRDLSHTRADPALTGARIIRDLHATVPQAPGELLVTVYSADRADWHLDTLINRAAANGAPAVLLEGTHPLRSASRALAHRLHLPVLGAPDPLAAYEAFVQVTGRRDITQAKTVLRAVALVERAGPRPEDVVAQVASAVARPVALLDSSGALIAGEAGIAGILAAAGQHPPTAPRQVQVTWDTTGGVVVARAAQVPGTRVWLAAHLASPVPGEPDAVHLALAVSAPAVGQRLAVAMIALERDARRRTSLLGELLAGPVTAGIRHRAVTLGWELNGWHTGIQIGTSSDPEQAPGRADVLAALRAEHLDPVVVESSQGWSGWLTSASEPSAAQVGDIAAAVRRAHHRLAAQTRVHTGVGRPHPGADGIARTLGEAADAARLARERPQAGYFLHVDRLGLAQLLLAWTRTDTFQPAARTLLDPLTRAPGDLTATLAAYLDCESNIAETAAVLGVHRNTVAARIHRIQAMLNVDLSAPDDRLALHLACRTALTEPGDPQRPRHGATGPGEPTTDEKGQA